MLPSFRMASTVWPHGLHHINCRNGPPSHASDTMVRHGCLAVGSRALFSHPHPRSSRPQPALEDRDRESLSGKAFQPPHHTLTLITDSSMQGWDGHVLTNGSTLDTLFSDCWSSSNRDHHINVLELKALRLTLERLDHQVTDNLVLCECVNTTAVAHINWQGGTRSYALYPETLRLFHWTARHRVILQAVHRKGRQSISNFPIQEPLRPSRMVIVTPRMPKPVQCWVVHDLFTSHANHKLP